MWVYMKLVMNPATKHYIDEAFKPVRVDTLCELKGSGGEEVVGDTSRTLVSVLKEVIHELTALLGE